MPLYRLETVQLFFEFFAAALGHGDGGHGETRGFNGQNETAAAGQKKGPNGGEDGREV
jgi:hypothetical protein